MPGQCPPLGLCPLPEAQSRLSLGGGGTGSENTPEARPEPASGFALSWYQHIRGQDWWRGAQAVAATHWAMWPSLAEGWRVPGVARSSGSGMRAGAHGGEVCASACLYRKEPTCSLRFQTSDISWATLRRGGGSQRQLALLPLPRQPGAPHLGTEPTALPAADAVAPSGARGTGRLSQGWSGSVLRAWPMAGGKEGTWEGVEEEPPGLERKGWRCRRGSRCAGAAGESGIAGGWLQSR